MRRVEAQIKAARRDAYAKDPTTTSGIAHNTILEYLNDGQDIMQSLISSAYAKFNEIEDIQSCVVNQEAYDVSAGRVFVNNRFISVELSESGNLQDYHQLRKGDFYDRDTDTGLPARYLRRGKQILLNPIPDSTSYKIRVNFEGELDDLDIRRGRIAGVTGAGTSGSPLTAIELETSAPTPDETDSVLADIDAGDYICVSDLDGNVIARNIPVTAYSSPNLTVTNFELTENDTLPAAGHYVTFGRYTTTHSKLPDRCDTYLVTYATWRILSHKGSTSASDAMKMVLASQEKSVLRAMASLGDELMLIPQLGDGLEY